MSTLGAALRAARERAGLTQAEAARRTGEIVSKQFLSELEADRYDSLSVARFASLCEVYGASADAILAECELLHRTEQDRVEGQIRRLNAGHRLAMESIMALVELMAGLVDDQEAIKGLREALAPPNSR